MKMPPTRFPTRQVRRSTFVVAVLGCALAIVGTGAVARGASAAAPRPAGTAPDGPPRAAPGCRGAACSPHLRAPGPPVTAAPVSSPDADAERFDLPRVGPDIRLGTRTCARSRGLGTATSSAACRTWVDSGPVNVVFAYRSTDPYRLLTRRRGLGWRSALGNHLVATGYLQPRTPGCHAGWTDSREQAELRLNHTDRRHLKFFHASCTYDGLHLAFADAHSDRFDLRRCGGDRMTDLDAARDAVVRGFSRVPGVGIEYRQDGPAGAVYLGGCGQAVVSDGRVAYITIA